MTDEQPPIGEPSVPAVREPSLEWLEASRRRDREAAEKKRRWKIGGIIAAAGIVAIGTIFIIGAKTATPKAENASALEDISCHEYETNRSDQQHRAAAEEALTGLRARLRISATPPSDALIVQYQHAIDAACEAGAKDALTAAAVAFYTMESFYQ